MTVYIVMKNDSIWGVFSTQKAAEKRHGEIHDPDNGVYGRLIAWVVDA